MKLICTLILFLCLYFTSNGQSGSLPNGKDISTSTETWLGLYTKYRIGKRTFYYGEYHFRRRNQFVQDMGNLYLRLGITYLVNKQFEVTAGIVTPFYWAPDQDASNIDKVVPQFRFWEQLLFVQPVGKTKLFHQFRFEQRWRRSFVKGSPFELTHRFRYKFAGYTPLNSRELVPGTLFLSFFEEIFIQAGKSIQFDYFEDNRVFLGLGYIVNPNLQVQLGHMWTFRHRGAPNLFESRHIPRLSFYHNLDFITRKIERRKQAPVMLTDYF